VLSSFVTMSLFDERVDPTASLTTIALFISSALTIFSLGKMLAKSPIQ
jgi:hypothetical protein